MMQAVVKENEIILTLSGRIDAENAAETEAQIIEAIADAPRQKLLFDGRELTYISSAGLRVLLSIHKKYKVPVEVIEVSPEIYDIFEVTGFSEIFHVKKRYKEISVEGCQILGSGFSGTVYRIDEETIVKVYQPQWAVSMIENERDMARKAFVRGIPTAISYDIVRVGDCYGSVFELIQSKTFNDMIIDAPERADEIIGKYVDFLKLVHETDMAGIGITPAKERFLGYIDTIGVHFTPQECERLRELAGRIPDSTKAVHGDIQMKNVMLSDGEPVVIDMDTLAVGNPVFDLQGIYLTYELFKEDEPDNTLHFLGIDADMSDRIWNRAFSLYYADRDADSLASTGRIIMLLARIRFLFLLEVSALKEGELRALRIRHTKEHIRQLISEIGEEDFDRL